MFLYVHLFDKFCQRKLEREYVHGGVSTATESARDEGGDDHLQDGEDEPIPSISGISICRTYRILEKEPNFNKLRGTISASSVFICKL